MTTSIIEDFEQIAAEIKRIEAFAEVAKVNVGIKKVAEELKELEAATKVAEPRKQVDWSRLPNLPTTPVQI
jgi:hypothetical protein